LKDETKRVPEAHHVLFIATAVAEGGALPGGVSLVDFGPLH